MEIKELLQGIKFSAAHPSVLEREALHLTCQSTDVKPGTLFVAIKGESKDGHVFVEDAFRKGAVACVTDMHSDKPFAAQLPLIRTENTRFVFSLLAARHFLHPSRDVGVTGITGTNGKTTTSFLVQHIFNRFSSCGLIGTVHYQIGNQIIPSKNTTPSAYDLNWMLAQMKKVGMKHCSMEISSHALTQDRAAHLRFRSAVFTNLTQDHLDYYKDMETYYQAKRKLFVKTPRPEKVFINIDNAYGARLAGEIYPRPFTFGIVNKADFMAHDIRVGLGGIAFNVRAREKLIPVRVAMPCLHNVYNVLGAFACAYEEGWDPEAIADSLRTFRGVPGRMQKVDAGQDFFVFVDYAHSPDAFHNVLSSVKKLAAKRIITVFGCGGDRDNAKRPLMGREAGLFSDTVVLTSDNPRSEDPEKILDQIQVGVETRPGKQVLRITNREEAIHRALDIAEAGDIVLVLGKGHENYQIVGDQKHPFDDRLVIEKLLRESARVGA